MKTSTLIIGGVVLGGLFLASEAAAWKTFDKIARPWRSYIREAAEKYGVSRHVVAAILYQESSYNPGKVGKAGEKGMGQTLPAAWADCQAHYDEFRGVDYATAIVDPVWQIRATAAYFAIQRKRAGNVYDGLRAYNAGAQGALDHPTVAVDYALNVSRMALVDWIFASLDGGKNG